MTSLIGQNLGKYTIEEPLGSGGMADVYKAFEPDLGRRVAIKTIKPEFAAQPEFEARFKREARIIANLSHPHIVPLLDYGVDNGVPYMVMPLMSASSLKDRMKQRPLTLPEIKRLMEQIAGALDYAHGQSVIHRDIKPGNILLDASGNALLSDFGIARMLHSNATQRTVEGIVQGTLEYMSPEQVSGDPNEIGPLSDIYSLGIMLYELVVGQLPFKGETPIQVLTKRLVEEPLPPRQANPTVSPSLEAVIFKALARQPERRYQTAGELASAIDEKTHPVQMPADSDVTVREALHMDEPTQALSKPARTLPTITNAIHLRGRQIFAAAVIVVIVLAVVIWGRNFVIDNRISSALDAANLSEARSALDTARSLGGDVVTPLETELLASLKATSSEENDQHVVHLASLYGEYAPTEKATALADVIAEDLHQQAADGLENQILHSARVLAVLIPARAGEYAGQFNDASVESLAQQPPQRTQARLYLEAVRTLDELVETARSGQEKSITLQNLGWLREQDSSLENPYQKATEAYREAIGYNDQNYEAYYLLSSLLLTHFASDKGALDEAVAIARSGWSDYLRPSVCQGQQNLANAELFQQSWYCFLLMTTEGGARLERGDSTETLKPLLEDAVGLAESNDGFGDGYFTAEAYFYLAKLTEPQTDPSILCAIIRERDRSNPRHQEWAKYANSQLGERRCTSG